MRFIRPEMKENHKSYLQQKERALSTSMAAHKKGTLFNWVQRVV